jgi:hypothetical protein
MRKDNWIAAGFGFGSGLLVGLVLAVAIAFAYRQAKLDESAAREELRHAKNKAEQDRTASQPPTPKSQDKPTDALTFEDAAIEGTTAGQMVCQREGEPNLSAEELRAIRSELIRAVPRLRNTEEMRTLAMLAVELKHHIPALTPKQIASMAFVISSDLLGNETKTLTDQRAYHAIRVFVSAKESPEDAIARMILATKKGNEYREAMIDAAEAIETGRPPARTPKPAP